MDAMDGVDIESKLKAIERARRSPVKGKNLISRAQVRLKEDEIEATGGSLIFLDPVDDLYTLDLNGNRIASIPNVDRISPVCPLCNNVAWADIDRLILSGASVRDVKEYCAGTVTDQDIINHQVRHILPIGREVLHESFPSLLEDVPDELTTKGFKKAVTRVGKAAEDIEGFTSQEEATLQNRFADRCAEHPLGKYVPEKMGRAREDVAFSGNGVYAVQEDRTLPVKLWSNKRMGVELENRKQNTVTFLGELMNCRKMAYHVYNETMKAGNPKYYGSAVSAIREVRGVVETLGKFSLIAKQLGDDTGKAKRLSPQMQDMMSKFGISVITNETNDVVGSDGFADDVDLSFIDEAEMRDANEGAE